MGPAVECHPLLELSCDCKAVQTLEFLAEPEGGICVVVVVTIAGVGFLRHWGFC